MKKLVINNKGKITIFATLIIGVLIILLAAIYQIMIMYMAKSKIVVASELAVTNLKSQYCKELFDQYHILSLDTNCGGLGLGAYEEEIKRQLEITLNIEKNEPIVNGFRVVEVAITPKQYLMDNKCQALKKQINEQVVYMGVKDVGELAIDKIDSDKYKISDEQWEAMDSDSKDKDEKSQNVDNNSTNGAEQIKVDNDTNGDKQTNENSKDDKQAADFDPRDDLEDIVKLGVVDIVKPKELNIRYERKDTSNLPSKDYKSAIFDFDIDTDFNGYSKMKKEVKSCGTWNDFMVDKGAAIYYASNVFKHANSNDIERDSVFDFEVEYLISGKNNDYDNLEGVVNRIIIIRMPVDFSYLVSDVGKMSQLNSLAIPIGAATLIPPSIIKYLLAGCWSYAEALADVRVLLQGDKQEFVKNKTNWITDINSLGTSMYKEKGNDTGMGYSDYLMTLLACSSDVLYYRMLDLMELNIKLSDSNFEIENCMVSYTVDVTIEYNEEIFQVSLDAEY